MPSPGPRRLATNGRVRGLRPCCAAWGSRTTRLQAEAAPLAGAGALDAPARELREDRVAVDAEQARRAAHVPARALEHAQDVLTLELLHGFAQPRADVLAEAR